MPNTKKIALEEHFLAPAMEDYWAPTVAQFDPAILGRAKARLLDFGESRLDAMDRAGIERAVLSLTTPGCNGSPMRRWRAAKQANATTRWLAKSRNGPAALAIASLPLLRLGAYAYPSHHKAGAETVPLSAH